MPAIASFHLRRDASPVRAMARLGFTRFALRSVPGLRFSRLLGTGNGTSTARGADLRRTAMFAIWDDDAALEAHLIRSASPQHDGAEHWHVRLRAIGGHGSWRNVDVLGQITPARTSDGPVAVITRADVRRGAWRQFHTAGRPVSDELQAADGLLAVVGFGEAPVGRLGTFSLWRDLHAVRAYAQMPRHRDVVRRARDEQWYGEELFARFEPYASAGRWDGRDPLAGVRRLPTTGSSIPYGGPCRS